MSSLTLKPYAPLQDEAWVYALWERALGSVWPLSREALRHKTVENAAYEAGDHIVACVDGSIAGFVATQSRLVPGEARPRGELMLIMVDPAYRRRGIGRTLLDQAISLLQQKSVEQVQLGSGALGYFWAGVPTNLPDAWAFFNACGWQEAERTFDLVGDLEGYSTPIGVYAALRSDHISLSTATSAEAPAVLAFEARHFPAWIGYYEKLVALGGTETIVCARSADGQIVGTSYAMDFRAPVYRNDFVWQSLLGANTGGIGPLGVAEPMREKGIGLALAARVTELLQSRGLSTSFVGYTWLVDWYGKLGYRMWHEYRIGRMKL